MKHYAKLFLFVCAILVVSTGFSQSKAQLARVKQRLVNELSISDAKADSVMNIVQDFFTNARAVKLNSELKDDERKLALQNNRKEEMARLRGQLNNQQIKKLQQMVTDMRDERQNRRMGKDSTSM